jgi:hypothetical protein
MEEMTEEQKVKRAEEDFKHSKREKSRAGRTVLHHSSTTRTG